LRGKKKLGGNNRVKNAPFISAEHESSAKMAPATKPSARNQTPLLLAEALKQADVFQPGGSKDLLHFGGRNLPEPHRPTDQPDVCQPLTAAQP
jgi:hypothetical protein